MLDNASFERLKHKYREMIENFEDQILKVERSKNMKMDTIQQVLALIRNIGGSYKEAKPTLKELYLSLFWHHIEVDDRKIVQAVKSPIVLALEAAGLMTAGELKKPIPSEYSEPDQSVRFTNVRGRSSWQYLTILSDPEYMAGIREKVKLIRQFQNDSAGNKT